MKKKFRLGLIGCGGIANVHMWGIKASPDLELAAICEILPDRLEQKKKQWELPDDVLLYTDYKKMMDSGKIDVVDICTPNNVHFEIAMEAVKRGLPYSVEKPVCNNAEDAAILLEATTKKNIPNMVCFSYRFISAARYARELVQTGVLGKIYHINGEYLQGWSIPDFATGATTPLVWRFDKEVSGTGTLGDLGCHLVDLMRFITGREFTRVTSDFDTFVHKRPMPDGNGEGDVLVDDYINMSGQMEESIAANLAISRFAFRRGNYQRIEIYGNKGALRYILDDKDYLDVNLYEEPVTKEQVKGWHSLEIPDRFKSSQMQAYADILNGCGDGLAATVEDGWKTQKVLDAAFVAAKNVVTV